MGLLAGPNVYGYVGGNPVRYSDPKGLLLPLAGAVPWLVGGSITGETGALILGGLLAAGTGAGAGATYDPDVIALPGDMPNAWDLADDNSSPVPIPLNPPKECKDKKDDDCRSLYSKIDRLVNELKRRFYQLGEDRMGLPATGTNSVAGHQQQFRNKQTFLRRLLGEANARGCVDFRKDAWYWATIPTPSP